MIQSCLLLPPIEYNGCDSQSTDTHQQSTRKVVPSKAAIFFSWSRILASHIKHPPHMQLLIYFLGNDCNFEIQKPLAGANVLILQLNRTLQYISENICEGNTVGNAVTESLFIIDHHCLVWQFDFKISDQSENSILFGRGGIFHISLGALNEAEGQYSGTEIRWLFLIEATNRTFKGSSFYCLK